LGTFLFFSPGTSLFSDQRTQGKQKCPRLEQKNRNVPIFPSVRFSLTAEQAKKLLEAAKKALVSESETLRRMLDAYLAEVDKGGLPSEPYGKMRFRGYEQRVVPRTIRKEQDSRLRELAEKTARSLSEFVREAVKRG
jgi:hypothetical protein